MLRRSLLAVVSGLVLTGCFEPFAVPYLMPLALAGFALSTRGLRARQSWVPGLLFGVAFYFTHIWWMAESIGVDAWLSLAGVEACFYGLLGAVAAPLHRLRAWPAWLAAAWLTTEVARSAWPFGGMPWGRLGFGVVDTPVAPLLAYVGVNGVGLLVAVLGFLLAALVDARDRTAGVASVVLLTAVMVTPTLLPYHLSAAGHVQVALVQGNVPGRGDNVAEHYREVTQNHRDATVTLADDVRAGRAARPDFVLWPENSTAVDPFKDLTTHDDIATAVAAIGVPVVVGAIVDSPDARTVLNQGIVWDPATGAGDRYTKWHPVPYGEYIPFRRTLPGFLSDRVASVPRDMLRGDRAEPLTVAGVRVADAICFDIAYDDGLDAQLRAGAQLIAVQTSNASFIRTDQIEQQFALTRARAIETGKWIAVASINGISGVIAPDGTVVATAAPRTRSVVDAQVGLTRGTTPAIGVAAGLAIVAPGLTLLGLCWSLVSSLLDRRRARRRQAGDEQADAEQPGAEQPVGSLES